MDTIDLIIYGMWFLIGSAIIGFGIYWFILVRKLRYHVQLREVTNERKLIRMFKGREFTDEHHVKWIKLYRAPKELRLLPFPNEDAIELDHKGKKHVIAHLSEGGDIHYVTDPTDSTELKSIPASQKIAYSSQIRRAHERKKIKWSEHIPMIAGFSFILIALFAVMLFGGDFWKQVIEPAKEVSANLVVASDNFKQVSENQLAIEQKLQMIDAKLDNAIGTNGGAPN